MDELDDALLLAAAPRRRERRQYLFSKYGASGLSPVAALDRVSTARILPQVGIKVLGAERSGGTMRSKLIKAWMVVALAVAVSVATLAGAAGAASSSSETGNGIGSKEALASPKCDPETGEIKILLITRAPCAAARRGRRTTVGRPPGA